MPALRRRVGLGRGIIDQENDLNVYLSQKYLTI